MFEYTTELFQTADSGGVEQALLQWLNRRGEEGWEAFFVEPVQGGYRCWFKREHAAVRQGLDRVR